MNDKSLTQSIVQYPTDLVFAVLSVDVSDQLTILKQETIHIDRWQFDFAIIGESHFVAIRHDQKFIMQEVLACTELPLILQAESHKFATLNGYHMEKQGYQAEVDFGTLPPTMSEEKIDGKLEMAFPEIYGLVPTTRVQWHRQKNLMIWKTLHVYPLADQTTYVITQSQFDLHRED